MHAGWKNFWRESGRRAPIGLIWFPLGLGSCFYGLSLARGETFSWIGLIQELATTFIISWTIFALIISGLALAYRFGMFVTGKPKQTPHFVFIGCLAMAGLCLGLIIAGKTLQTCCDVPFSPDFGYFAGSLFTGGLITAALIFRTAYRSSRRQVAELERATAESRYETLKAQMQPHFLFNSLNSLSELIDADMPEAASMTARLADLYRHILENSKEKTTTLASELTIIRDYLELERLRFGKRLQFSIKSEVDEQSVFIPSLILQTLVENAVKHGISPSIAGGEVEVNATVSNNKWTTIEIRNSGSPPKLSKDGSFPATNNSTGTGLANAKERLTLMYGENHGFYFGLDDNGRTIARFSVSGVKLG